MPAVSSRGRGRRSMNEINMVPFIDVMLVLLIIFMVTAPLITTGLVDLPSVGGAAQRPAVVVEIIIGADQQMQLRSLGKDASKEEGVTMNDLLARVRELQAGDASAPVVISADKNVKYDSVVRVMDLLQKNGVKRVGLSVRQGS